MRNKSIAVACLLSFALSGCTVASPWTEVQPEPGWIGIEATKGNTSVMLACRIPTSNGRAGVYELRLKYERTLLNPNQTIRISRLRDTLAVTLVGIERVNGYYIALINEDEAARVFASITEPGGVIVESKNWLEIEIGIADDDEAKLDNFVERCRSLL